MRMRRNIFDLFLCGLAAALLLLPGVALAQNGDNPGLTPSTGTGNIGTSTQQAPVGPANGVANTGGLTHEEQAAPGSAVKERGGLTFLPELKPTDGSTTAPVRPKLPPQAGAVTLDRAVAVINGEVILASDVREQQHFAVFEPVGVPKGEFTPLEAMQQIVNRTLLLEQMSEQQLAQPPSDEDVNKQIAELRRHIPGCNQCESDEGWRSFLTAHGYSEKEFHRRWKERMQILNFIGVRFRMGIRIAKPEIEKYYRETLVPQFNARKLPPPPLANVSSRIEEVLLEQHVNVLLTDYLRSLKDAGSVQILDPAYNQLGTQGGSAGTTTTTASAPTTTPETPSGGDQ